MKFLLTALNAKYIHSNPAIYSLRSFAGPQLQEHVELAEYTINQTFSDILADIYRKRPDVIGFSCYIWNIRMILDLAGELKKLLPELPIWLGGPEAAFDAPGLLEKHPFLEGVMVGEGEETFRELLEYYVGVERSSERMPQKCEEGGQTMSPHSESDEAEENASERTGLHRIPGLCLAAGFTAPRAPLDMDSLPFPYGDLESFENRIIYYESSRGCPFRCSYCLSSIDKKVRFRSLQLVKQELQFFLDHRVPQVKFVDRTFNCDHRHTLEVWNYISEHDNGVTNFHFEVSGDLLNREELKVLSGMRPGLVQLEMGVQSTNPETLSAIDRVMDLEKLEQVVRTINQIGNVHQHLDLIAGLPYEDYESFGRSFNRVYAMNPQQLQLGFLKVLKGSPMQEKASEYGICYLDKPPYEVLCTRWLPYEGVLRLKRVEEMVELYYNSNQFRYTLGFLVHQFETPFVMFEELGAFYERKGYFVNSPARAYRYQVLLDFAREKEIYPEICGELLTYDMYLRENLKSRPEFACDLTPHKQQIRRFYEQEEQNRAYLWEYEGYDQKQLAKMTHMEPFTQPVWEPELWKHPEQKGTSVQYVLFEYRNRNLLTGDAAVYVVSPP